MPSSCFSCIFATKDTLGNQSGCTKDYIKLIPPSYLGEETHADKKFTVSMLACPMQVTHTQKEVLGDKVEEYLEKKNRLYIDYLVFLTEDSGGLAAFKTTLASILRQSPSPRKVAVIASDNNLGLSAVKLIPGLTYWSLHIPGEPIPDPTTFLNSSYFYEVSNESVKIVKSQNPPRPHNVTYCEAGYEYPPDYAETLQERSLTFKPFLAIYPAGGAFNGLTLNRRFYSMMNSNKTENVLAKLDQLPEVYPDQMVNMLLAHKDVFGMEKDIEST